VSDGEEPEALAMGACAGTLSQGFGGLAGGVSGTAGVRVGVVSSLVETPKVELVSSPKSRKKLDSNSLTSSFLSSTEQHDDEVEM
jgi:hypothetical protein